MPDGKEGTEGDAVTVATAEHLRIRTARALTGSPPGIDLGEGNGNPLQCSCLEHPMDRGAWWATAHEVTRVGLSN